MTLKLVDRFTTQDGSWELDSSKPYGICESSLEKYGGAHILFGKGHESHIFVTVRPGYTVRFNTSDRGNPITYYVGNSLWIAFPMPPSSTYAPSRGEQGPWVVWVNNVQVAEGIGLPDGLDVSTFLIVEDVGP